MVARRIHRSIKSGKDVKEDFNREPNDADEKIEESEEEPEGESDDVVSSDEGENSETNDSDEHDHEGSDDHEEEDENEGNGGENSDETGSEDDDGSDEDDDDRDVNDDDNESASVSEPIKIKAMSSASGEQCTFDLLNLLALNSHQVEVAKLYSSASARTKDEKISIPGETMSVEVNEQLLLDKATDGCTQLIHALWQLSTERSDNGPLIVLPSFSETRLPRQLPPPPPKTETKWEKFAKERGLPLNKNKRSQKVWDESEQDWKFRHGYNKANNDAKEWPIMEIGPNDDPFDDPWERVRDEKRGKVEKNLLNRMKNAETAGVLPKGSAIRAHKARAGTRLAGKAGGNADRDLTIPVGVPVDLKARKGSADINSLKRGRENTHKALLATQRSTASLGKFDGLRAGEPEKRNLHVGGKKRKFESATDRKVIASESDRGMKVLDAVMNGGGKERDRAKRKGTLAKGETAYDYDFDDGLGPSSFKKKKGRAGAGKMKKMTKKRAK